MCEIFVPLSMPLQHFCMTLIRFNDFFRMKRFHHWLLPIMVRQINSLFWSQIRLAHHVIMSHQFSLVRVWSKYLK